MSKRAFLLIADIGGYTRFMTVHRINLSHAQYVVAQLLEAVIDAAGSRLKLSKLEGDAAFFYGDLDKDGDATEYASLVSDIRRAFVARRNELTVDRLCNCDGCTQAGDLNLKFVAHQGEIALQKIKQHTELAGVDVILVHRFLKNSVPVPEYVLMSEPVHEGLSSGLKEHACEIHHEFEGFGRMRGYYIDLLDIARDIPPVRATNFWRKLAAWWKMTWRSIPYFIGLRTPCDGFRNMTAVGLPAPKDAAVLEARPSAD